MYIRLTVVKKQSELSAFRNSEKLKNFLNHDILKRSVNSDYMMPLSFLIISSVSNIKTLFTC